MPYSQWWRSVVRCREVFKCGTIYKLGDGKDIRLWYDIWIGEAPLSSHFPELLDRPRNKDVRVARCWNLNGWRWRFICRGSSTSRLALSRRQLSQLKALLLPLHPISTTDSTQWRWTSNLQFTVKSLQLGYDKPYEPPHMESAHSTEI